MNARIARFLSVFTMVSRIPLKVSYKPDYTRADFWIPAMSPLVSLVAVAGWYASAFLFKDFLLEAITVIALQYLCFNLFHLDGLLDTADAMAGYAKPERRLEILKDPHLGSYALFFGWFVLATKAASLSLLFSYGPQIGLPVLLAAPLAGRLAGALVAIMSRPARPDGLGHIMRDFKAQRILKGAGIGALPLVVDVLLTGRWLLGGMVLASAIVSAGIAAIYLARLYEKKIGGFTGDALGASVETAELLCFLILACGLRFILR
jgi:adenosylcobinamide-GDP ribazoletransferase